MDESSTSTVMFLMKVSPFPFVSVNWFLICYSWSMFFRQPRSCNINDFGETDSAFLTFSLKEACTYTWILFASSKEFELEIHSGIVSPHSLQCWFINTRHLNFLCKNGEMLTTWYATIFIIYIEIYKHKEILLQVHQLLPHYERHEF